jgi:transcriptional regulator with XRE-family HTH domain
MYDKLITFIKTELEERGWSHRELARRARISQTSVSGTLAKQRTPGADFCIKVAKAFGVEPEFMLRLAGILPPLPPGDDALQAAVLDAFKRLSIEKRREVLAYARWQLEREQQAAAESSDTGENQATAATSA